MGNQLLTPSTSEPQRTSIMNCNTTTTPQPTHDDCLICLQALDPRGGNIIMSPGCCGKFYHQHCVNQIIKNASNAKCPNCRKEFQITASVPLVSAVPPTQIQAPFQLPIPPTSRIGSRYFSSSYQAALSTPPVPVAVLPMTEELLEEDSSSANTASESKVSTKSESDSVLTVKCQPERKAISVASQDGFFVNVSLKATADDENIKRMPMDIVCVLDNSGSMSGSKLDSVKAAMAFVTSQLTSSDRLSVINFNSFASPLHGLLKMTDANKERSTSKLNQLSACGGTDIYAGMLMSFDTLFKRQTFNKSCCILLLTDGQDGSQEIEKIELGKKIRAMGYSLYVFGFGNDHDDKQLKLIANASEGSYSFVNEDSEIVEAFGGCLGGQQSLVAKNVTLTIELPFPIVSAERHSTRLSSSQRAFNALNPLYSSTNRDNDNDNDEIKMLQVFSGKYPQIKSSDNKSVQITFANMFAGESRDILVKLALPACSPADMQQQGYAVLTSKAKYETVNGETKNAAADSTDPYFDATFPEVAHCKVIRTSDKSKVDSEEVDVSVDTQRNRMLFVETMDQVKVLAAKSQYSQAKQAIQACEDAVMKSVSHQKRHQVCESLLEDLKESKLKVENESSYTRFGGSAQLEEYSDSHERQRSVYTKKSKATVNPYQNMSSLRVQSKATASKQSL